MLLKTREPLELGIEQEKNLLNAGVKPPVRIKNRLQRTAAKLLAGFFALMLVFTLVSRASDSITAARAKTDTIKSGVITNRISMDGVIKPIEDMNITLPGDIYVPNIKAGVGQRVKKGDVLLEFDDDDVKQQLDKLRSNLNIIELRLKAVETGIPGDNSSSVFYARQALEQAQSDYQRISGKLERNRKKAEEELLSAEKELSDALNGFPEDDDNIASAQSALEQAQADYERIKEKTERNKQKAEDDLLSAERELSDALNDIPDSDDNIASARLALEQAQTDYERIKEKTNLSKQRAEEDLTSVEKTLSEAQLNYSAAVDKAKADTIKAAEDKVKSARSALASAKESADEAVSNAHYAYESALEKETANERTYYSALNDVQTAWNKLTEANQELDILLNSDEADEAGIAAAIVNVKASQDAYDAANNRMANMSLGESLDFRRARENLDGAQEKWARKTTEPEIALEEALADLSAAKEKTDMTDQQPVISAQSVVDSAQKAVNSAQRSLEDINQNNADQLLNAERALQTAQRNLRAAVESSEKAVNSAKKSLEETEENNMDQLLNAERALQTAQRNLRAAVESSEKAVDSAKKSLEETEENNADQLLTAQRAIESADKNLQQALKQADDTAKSDEKSRKQAEIDRITYLGEKQTIEKSIALLEEIIDLDGKLISPIDGTIQSIANTGKTQDKVPIAVISHNDLGFFFETKIDQKSAEKLIVGDKGVLNYTSEGKNNEVEAVITNIGAPDENGKVPVTASLPVKAYPSGISADLTVTRNSERQESCLPLSALRSNSSEDYVLVLRENKTVLGIKYTVTAVPVTVLSRDNEQMSVNSSLTRDDKVIISTNKPVSEGDRVRYEKD